MMAPACKLTRTPYLSPQELDVACKNCIGWGLTLCAVVLDDVVLEAVGADLVGAFTGAHLLLPICGHYIKNLTRLELIQPA